MRKFFLWWSMSFIPLFVLSQDTLCPQSLLLDSLTCSDYFFHFDVASPGSVLWQVDGVQISTPSAELYWPWDNGLHEVIAWYYPTGDEGCNAGGCPTCAITFYDTLTVSCMECTPVTIGVTSVLDLGGTATISNYTLMGINSGTLVQNSLSFTADQPVQLIDACLADDCYQLHVCSPTPIADSNLFVDAVAPFEFVSQQFFSVPGCFGVDVLLDLNSNCTLSTDTCDGSWMVFSSEAVYLTMPPFFSPDTLSWYWHDWQGSTLDSGVFVYSDNQPFYTDSVCVSSPLLCYDLTLDFPDDIFGFTYLDYSAQLDTVSYFGYMNANVNHDMLSFVMSDSCGNNVAFIQPDGVTVFPNPASDEFTVASGGIGPSALTIMDMQGRIVFYAEGPLLSTRVDCTLWPSGLYVMCIDQQGIRQYKKQLVLH